MGGGRRAPARCRGADLEHGQRDRRSEGAYFWRPPGILHGPYGSLKGCVSFIRTVGGPLVDEGNDPEATFSYDPEPHVAVPPELEPYGTNHWKPGTCFCPARHWI